jgi:transposase-like protein
MDKQITATEWKRLQSARWTPEDARRVLAEWKASGESVLSFSRRHGVKEPRVSWWKKRISEWREPESARPTFAPAIVVPQASTSVSIRLPAGPVIEVAETTPEWLAAFVSEFARPG